MHANTNITKGIKSEEYKSLFKAIFLAMVDYNDNNDTQIKEMFNPAISEDAVTYIFEILGKDFVLWEEIATIISLGYCLNFCCIKKQYNKIQAMHKTKKLHSEKGNKR